MQSLWQTTLDGLYLLIILERDLWEIIAISFGVSLQAVVYTAPMAIALGYVLAYRRFPGRQLVISLINTLWAMPAVVVGLTLYLLFSRVGPLGDWKLLFTQTAMVIGQMLLCFPVLVSISHTTFQSGDRRALETAITLGATSLRAVFTVTYEVRFGLAAALVAGFGRVVAEVGCSMMIGGNILHYTRNIPTAIALETSRGAFAQGIALGIVLVALALVLNFAVAFFRGRGEVL